MFKNSEILDCLSGGIGWRESSDPCLPTLSSSVSSSRSGLVFNDAHPLLSLDNIEALAPNFSSYNYPEWDVLENYSIGDGVLENKIAYIATVANVGSSPSANPDDWETSLSIWLSEKTRAYSLQYINEIIQQKKLDKITKSLLEDRFIFVGMGSLRNRVIKESRFVGFRIRVRQYENLLARINRLGFQFDAPENFNFYVYHDSQPEAPIQTIPVVTTTAPNFQNVPIPTPLEMSYNSTTYDAGGFFYVGYYEDDITGQAINQSFNFAKGSCGCANRSDDIYFRKYTKYLELVPVSFSSSGIDGTKLPDTDFMSIHYSNNFGVNFNISVECDLTDIFCRHQRELQFPLQKYIGGKFLSELANASQRLNRIKSEVQQLAGYALSKEGGYSSDLKNSMNEVGFDFSDLDPVCLPCNEKNGIRIKTM